MTNPGKGTVFIVSAPSGGGKTSLVRELITTLPDIDVSVSHTTRSPRPSEQDGQHYFFVSEPQFTNMVQKDAFVEHAEVFHHHYGTSHAEINRRLLAGKDVVLDIDWQGAAQIRRVCPEAVSIFIVPPSLAVLQQRLEDRRQDADEVIRRRMQQAQDEMSHYAEFDYLIVNDSFVHAARELQAIVISRRLAMERQIIKVGKLLSLLLASQ